MSTTGVAKLFPLTIESPATVSRTVVAKREYGDAVALHIFAPASLEGGITRTIRTSMDGITWKNLVDAGGAVALPVAGQSKMIYEVLSAPYWQISYSVAPASPEIWHVAKSWSLS